MVRLWERSRAAETALGLAGLLAFPVAALLLGGLYLASHPGPGRVQLSGGLGILLVVGILLLECAVTAVAHELVHALATLLVGRTPRLHFRTTPYPMLSLDEDVPYDRARFVVVRLAPVVLLTALLAPLVVTGPYAGWLIVPAAFNLTASTTDVAFSIVALRQRAGTSYRVAERGLELTEPVDEEVP